MTRGKSASTIDLQGKVVEVTDNLCDYWPLTLRQIFYQLVAAGHIENNSNRYKALSVICSDMRKDGLLSWAVMEDRMRRVSGKRGWKNVEEFIASELNSFLRPEYYDRCLVQQVDQYAELWVEKDALSRIFEDVAYSYCVRVVTCRGQVSTTFLKDYADRAKRAAVQGKRPVIIYGGDLDPSGWKIPIAAQETLFRDFGVDVEFDRLALNLDQVEKYRLPNNPDALKWSDANAREYVRQYGEVAVELDALSPATLTAEIKTALGRHLDAEAMDAEREIQERERAAVKTVRRQVTGFLEGLGYAI